MSVERARKVTNNANELYRDEHCILYIIYESHLKEQQHGVTAKTDSQFTQILQNLLLNFMYDLHRGFSDNCSFSVARELSSI